jgi:hypothetical protein
MKSQTPDEVSAILKAHGRNFTATPISYSVEATADKPHRWISQVALLSQRGTNGERVSDPGVWFDTEEKANNWAWFIAADWLKEND